MKPPSRKHHEKTEIERLKDRIAKLEKKQPEALGIQSTIDALRMQAKRLVAEKTEAKAVLHDLRMVADWFDVLKRSEVMIPTQEGMKYLVGQDLEDYCIEEIKKQGSTIWWSESTPNSFSSFAGQAITEIIRDEVDKMAETQLDAYKYITKGRYDTRSQS